jgi:hypothetical protein
VRLPIQQPSLLPLKQPSSKLQQPIKQRSLQLKEFSSRLKAKLQFKLLELQSHLKTTTVTTRNDSWVRQEPSCRVRGERRWSGPTQVR